MWLLQSSLPDTTVWNEAQPRGAGRTVRAKDDQDPSTQGILSTASQDMTEEAGPGQAPAPLTQLPTPCVMATVLPG